MTETILVVGGTGMLGEPVARQLSSAGHAVRVLSRSRQHAEAKLGPGFEVVEGDVLDLSALERARCTMFMETLPNFVREGKAMVMGEQPTPWRWVAAADYAEMVVKAYTTPAAAGKTLYVYGPEALTMEQAVEQYRGTCAPDAELVHVPFWILSIIAKFPSRTELRRVGLPLMRYFSRVREIGDSAEADALLGKPATTLAEWCRARARRK